MWFPEAWMFVGHRQNFEDSIVICASPSKLESLQRASPSHHPFQTMGFSLINHPILGYPHDYGNPQLSLFHIQKSGWWSPLPPGWCGLGLHRNVGPATRSTSLGAVRCVDVWRDGPLDGWRWEKKSLERWGCCSYFQHISNIFPSLKGSELSRNWVLLVTWSKIDFLQKPGNPVWVFQFVMPSEDAYPMLSL